MSSEPSFVLAVDIGGTWAKFGLIDSHGRLHGELTQQRVPFRADGSADPHQLIDMMEFRLAEIAAQTGQRVPVGLSLCGNVDLESGEAVLVANLRWRNVPFGPMIAERLRVPVYSGTDVRQAVLAEAVWGVAKGLQNVVWGTVGTGYGGYVFLNGRLYRGANGFAGNFGHTPLDEINGYPCGCGHRGCVETFVAGPGIGRAGQAAVDAGKTTLLREWAAANQGQVTPQMVFEAVAAGDPVADDIINQVIRLICQNLAGVVNLLDPDMIVLGGGVVRAAPWFIQRIDRQIRDFLMTVEAQRNLRIEQESFPNSALWGAAVHAFIMQNVLADDVLEIDYQRRASV